LESSAAAGLGVAGTNEVGIPVDGLGNSRPSADSAALSTDPGQTCLYAADLANGTSYVINRENLHELDRIGRSGRQIGEFHWLHAVAVDSEGNIYTGEVDSGPRIQKFLRYGKSRMQRYGQRRGGPLQSEQVAMGAGCNGARSCLS
jgi:hypothetical protein